MSADFWSGYASGAIGILVGNPLDVLKVKKQATGCATVAQVKSFRNVLTGTAAPIAGYGALNATLFVAYNRTEAALNKTLPLQNSLWTTWLAGAAGGLSIWAVSTPTELIKCRAQLSKSSESSWDITKQLWRHNGLKSLYLGGVVTALRDSIGYGFYFWAYEGLNRSWPESSNKSDSDSMLQEAPKILFCGGLAGIITWASVFPLDVVKTRVQIQPLSWGQQDVGNNSSTKLTAMKAAKDAYKQGGVRVFFAGLTVCSVRAFIVNAVQWGVYEWMMHKMGHGRKERLLAQAEHPAA